MTGQRQSGWINDVDVVVVGAGPGGLSAAALLSEAGARVLVLERESRHGGRASTIEIDGFLVPTGAVGLELGGHLDKLMTRLGRDYDVRVADPMQVLRIGGRTLNLSSPRAQAATDWVLAKLGPRALRRLQARDPDGHVTMADWMRRLPRRSRIRAVIRSVIASIYAVNLEEIPAHLVIRYFVEEGGFRNFGFGGRGTVGVWDELAEAVTKMDGQVWLDAEVLTITEEDGRVTGVEVEHDGERMHVPCRVVISDAGPAATVDLLPPEAIDAVWVSEVRNRDVPAPMIVIDIASQRRLFPPAGGLFFAESSRLCGVAHLTEKCPDLAPPGWRLYVAYGVPKPALGPYDADAETAIMMGELASAAGGLDDVKIIRTRVATDAAAPVKVPAGRELPWRTPLAGLYLVGDGVREPGHSGMEACVSRSEVVANEVLNTLTGLGVEGSTSG